MSCRAQVSGSNHGQPCDWPWQILCRLWFAVALVRWGACKFQALTPCHLSVAACAGSGGRIQWLRWLRGNGLELGGSSYGYTYLTHSRLLRSHACCRLPVIRSPLDERPGLTSVIGA